MSDYRYGEKPYPVREYDNQEPIRGSINFSDGTKKLLTMSRYVNKKERKVTDIDLDGERYVRAPIPDYDTEVFND